MSHARLRCEVHSRRREATITPTDRHHRTCPQCRSCVAAAPHWDAPRFLRCPECGVIFRDPFPTQTQLAEYYCDGWSAPEQRPVETGNTDAAISAQLVDALSRSLSRPLAGVRILDFGAGRGAMSLELKKRGAEVVAVEPFGYDYLASRGITVYGDLSELPSGSRFDGVVCIEVIEHIRDPIAVLAGLRDLLAPDGWLFITTPNAAGLPAKLMGQRWREADKPGHVVFFTPITLTRALERAGFEPVCRPRWRIRFPSASPLRAAVHSALQILAIDGGLRLIAFKGSGPPYA